MGELDRVLGGGVVKGSCILVGGEPGIGKSTLLLQTSAIGKKALYVSGEESLTQVGLRCRRLKLTSSQLLLLSENNMEGIERAIKENEPEWVVIDSIQAIYSPRVEGIPGSITQIRECASRLIHIGKSKNIILFLIGHVTKEGTIAGPKILEHMVDTVLYFEGEKNGLYRILRTIKNRFGPSPEVGIFEMTSQGLKEVKNPTGIFLSAYQENLPGTIIFPSVEGSRPLLVEIQVLLSETSFYPPRRVVSGLDYNRVILLLAVMEKRLGYPLHKYDLFVNVVGGLRIWEPAVDLPFCLAVISSLKNKPLSRSVAMGEVGLGGEIRGIGLVERRIGEAVKLGFQTFLIPKISLHQKFPAEIDIIKGGNLGELVKRIFSSGKEMKRHGN